MLNRNRLSGRAGLLAAACMLALVSLVPCSRAQAPLLGQMSRTEGAPGTAVTITGEQFGSLQGKSTIQFGEAPANVRYWSKTYIIVYVPAAASGSVDVVLTIDEVKEEHLGSFTIQGSSQSSSVPVSVASPANGSTGTQSSIVQGKPNGQPPASPSLSGPPAPKSPDNPASPPTPTAPVISAIIPARGVAGTTVTITGSGFGDTQGKSMVTIGAQPVTVSTKNWSDNKIVATAPDLSQSSAFDPKKDLNVTVTVSIADAKTGKITSMDASDIFIKTTPQWGDDDEIPVSVKMVGGYEQGFQSSQSSNSDAFIAVYGHRLFDDRIGPFYSLRLQSAPQASGTNSVVSVFSNPSGGVTTQNLQTVGSAVDLSLGMEYQFARLNKGQTTLGVIGGGGFLTPLQLNSISTAFTMPAFGTVECAALQSRLSSVLNNPIYAGIKANTASTSTSCFSNITSSTPTALTLLEYAAPDQPNFFPKYGFGLRVINRWPGTAAGLKLCNSDNPCERGYVDFTLGQNAGLTGGSLQHMALNIDSIYPITLSKPSFLYLFGSISRRFGNLPPSVPPLVLATGAISTTPAASTLILPLTQPDRDFYRIGVGINLNEIFNAMKSKSSTNQ